MPGAAAAESTLRLERASGTLVRLDRCRIVDFPSTVCAGHPSGARSSATAASACTKAAMVVVRERPAPPPPPFSRFLPPLFFRLARPPPYSG
eukprot:scaffold9281_cov32-Tisochrysis_lutea.AAC.2